MGRIFKTQIISEKKMTQKALANDGNNRIPYLDLLRIIAIIAVIFQHFCPAYYGAGDYNRNAVNIMVSLTDWCVPVFVMISGHCC